MTAYPQFDLQFLIALLSRGIVPKKHSLEPFKGAIGDGRYMGCPGMEIFYSMDNLSPSDIEQLAPHVASAFPASPPGRAVHLSSFLRYMFGCFDKQGCLRSAKQAELWKQSKKQDTWIKPTLLLDHMISYFRKRNNLYGEMILFEMKAHRIGDTVYLTDDYKRIPDMLNHYRCAAKLAKKCMARKNICSTYYWGMRYLVQFNQDPGIILNWARIFLRNVERFSNSSTVKGKVGKALRVIRAYSNEQQWNDFLTEYNTFTRKVMHKNYPAFGLALGTSISPGDLNDDGD